MHADVHIENISSGSEDEAEKKNQDPKNFPKATAWAEAEPELAQAYQASDFEGWGWGKLSLAGGFQAEPSWHITNVQLGWLKSHLMVMCPVKC